MSEPARRGRKFAGEQPECLFGRHFPEFIPAIPGAKRAHDCAACNKRKKDREGFRRKQTTFRIHAKWHFVYLNVSGYFTHMSTISKVLLQMS